MQSLSERLGTLMVGCFICAGVPAQTSTTPSKVKTAFASTAVSAVTLNGTFVSIEGSLRQAGDVHLSAGSDGTYSILLGKQSGAAGEKRTLSAPSAECTWNDSRGDNFPIDPYNCQTPTWFLPLLPTLLSSQSSPEWKIDAVGKSDASFHLLFTHISTTGSSDQPVGAGPALDVEVSNESFLPTKANFVMYTENSSRPRLSVEVQYQDYRLVNGVNVPFRIKRFVNGTLVLDITVTNASAI